MSIGTFSIGSQAIGGDGVCLEIPSIAITVAVNTPALNADVEVPAVSVGVTINVPGVSVFLDTPYGNAIGEEAIGVEAIGGGGKTDAATVALLGTIDVTVATFAPAIYAGKRVDVPAVDVTVAVNTPIVGTSAKATLSNSVDIDVNVYPPHLEHVINVAGIDIVTNINVPLVATGKRVDVPEIALTVTTFEPFVTAGKSVAPPPIDITVTLDAPAIETGLIIRAWNTAPLMDDAGSIGTTGTGRFAIGESGSDDLARTYSIEIQTLLHAPFITAGKSVYPPSVTIATAVNRPEISARTRRVRVQFISY